MVIALIATINKVIRMMFILRLLFINSNYNFISGVKIY